jgi:hypothetical protein
MPSSAANGTQTAVISTEHTLSTQTAAGTYVLAVDATNMVDGDVLEVRAKVKVLTGGSALQYLLGSFANAQADPVKMSLPVPSLYSITVTLKQVAGTGRNFDWNLVLL